jgi:hypothetical protein
MLVDTLYSAGYSAGEIDRLCAQIALALHNAEFQIYGTLALIIVMSALLFPPKDDPDQI